MNHLDEGTIHAWLDGALDAEQAREVEAHVRGCASCGAAVAEARGLIAASSRILNALDDVPGNVIPPARPAAAPKRQWRAAPWVTGIAAILLATILLRSGRDEPRDLARSAKLDTVQGETQAMLDTLRPRQTPARVALAPVPPAKPVRTSPVDVAVRGTVSSAAEPRADRRDAPVEDKAVAVAAPAEPASPAAQAPVARTAPAAGAGVAAGAARAENLAASDKAVGDQMRRRAALAPAPTLHEVIVTGLAERAMLPDSLPPEGVAGCYLVDRSLVRLETRRLRSGYLVRAAASDSSVGWWHRLTRDSASVNIFGVGERAVSSSQRVPCP